MQNTRKSQNTQRHSSGCGDPDRKSIGGVVCSESRSPHREALLVQQLAGGASHLHAPVSTLHGLAAVGAIALRLVGTDPQLRRFAQRVSLKPPVEDDAVA